MSRLPGFVVLTLFLAWPAGASFHEALNTGTVPSNQLPSVLKDVTIEQHVGARIPLDLRFIDELGRPILLSEVVRDRPVILTLNYFRCPSLCSMILTGLREGLREVPMTLGTGFRVVTVSISPSEGPPLALARKRSALVRYGRAPLDDDFGGWRMLTGREPEIRELARSVGFGYSRDPRTGEYSHASVVMILTPQGRVSQYLFGVHYPAEALAAALSRAASPDPRARIGSPIAALLLYCFHYDPESGIWSLRIMGLLRALGVLTVVALAGPMILAFRKERVG